MEELLFTWTTRLLLVHYFGYHGRRRTFVIKNSSAAAPVRMPPSVRHHGGLSLSLRYKANNENRRRKRSQDGAAVSPDFH
jgi:hypothetical protein